MSLVGPDNVASKKVGVFISKIKPGGPVERETEGKVKPGMRVLAINGKVGAWSLVFFSILVFDFCMIRERNMSAWMRHVRTYTHTRMRMHTHTSCIQTSFFFVFLTLLACCDTDGSWFFFFFFFSLRLQNTVDLTRPETVTLMKSSAIAVMTVQFDPKGFAQYVDAAS